MKRLFLKKQNIIALALTAAMLLTGGLSYVTSQAAGYITQNTSSVTINVDPNGDIFGDLADGATIDVKLYQIGTVESTGEIKSNIDGLTFDSETKAADMEAKIATAEANLTGIIPVKLQATASEASVTNNDLANGVYLVVIGNKEETVDVDGTNKTIHYVDGIKYKHTFSSFIITAPDNQYVSSRFDEDGNVKSDITDGWIYNQTYNAKPGKERQLTELNIVKDLKSYNVNNGLQTFTFKVNYTDKYDLDGEKKVSQVYTIDFYEAGNQRYYNIFVPTDIDVTVEETYQGSSYQKQDDVVYTLETYDSNGNLIESTEATGHTVADKTLVATFTNVYKPGNNYGTTGVKNHFEKEDGEWTYIEDQPLE